MNLNVAPAGFIDAKSALTNHAQKLINEVHYSGPGKFSKLDKTWLELVDDEEMKDLHYTEHKNQFRKTLEECTKLMNGIKGWRQNDQNIKVKRQNLIEKVGELVKQDQKMDEIRAAFQSKKKGDQRRKGCHSQKNAHSNPELKDVHRAR